MLILAVLAIGVAASVYHGRAGVYAQRDRLSVLELVNGRLELLRSAPFSEVSPLSEDDATYYLRHSAGVWTVTGAETDEAFLVNSRSYAMRTTVEYIDVDGGSPSYDALKFTVSMPYRPGGDDRVTLSTYRAP